MLRRAVGIVVGPSFTTWKIDRNNLRGLFYGECVD